LYPHIVPRKVEIANSRRELLQAASLASAVALLAGLPVPTYASGGATAGRDTSIPNGKRRYGRVVTAWVATFLSLESAIKSGDLAEAKAFMKDGDTGFWQKFKDFGFLLGMAFVEDSKIPPEKRPAVKVYMKLLEKLDAFKKDLKSGKADAATTSYADAKKVLAKYLEEVELPPMTDAAWSTFDDWKLGFKKSTTNLYGVESEL